MKSVTKEQRALCAKALWYYREFIVGRHAQYGDRSPQDFDDAYEAKHLAEQFEKEAAS